MAAPTVTVPSLSFTMPGVPPLAAPSFTTGPNDSLAVVDNYTASGGVINSIQDQLANLGVIVPDVLRGGAALASILPIVTGIKNGIASANPAALVARLLSSASQITSAFAFLGPDVQNEILSGLGDIAPIAITVAGLAKQVSVTNFSNLQSVGNLLSSFTGSAEAFGIIDPAAIGSIVGAVVGQLNSYGVTGVFGVAMAGITDASIIARASGIALPGIIAASDIVSLGQMAGLLPPSAILTLNPLALTQLASSYARTSLNAMGVTNPQANDGASFSALFGTSDTPGTFDQVSSDWNVAPRETSAGTANATDISSLMGGSDDFTSVLSNGVKSLDPADSQQDYAIATTYPDTDVMSNLQNGFPYVPFGTGTSSVASSGTNSALTNNISDQVSTNFPAASTNPTTSNDTTQYTQTVWGTKVAVGTHSLLGYDTHGDPVYADADYNDGEMLLPTPN